MNASAVSAAPVRPSVLPPPPVPATLEETGLPADLVSQLLLKALYTGEASGTALAERLRLAFTILDPIVQHARAERLLEVRGAAGVGTAGYRYALTDLGRDRARLYLDACQYAGAAPVPLAHYVAYMKAVGAARPYLDRERITGGFAHLVVSPAMFDQLGPAVNSGKSIFLYGAPGNGKTVIAEGIGVALGGDIYAPNAIEVDGQIITIFDPVNHRRVDEGREGRELPSPALVTPATHDRRWERIQRPVVVVGGELTLDMLDLSFNPISKFYEAPVQLKANGGVFIVDDFGRQRVPPRDLLNRWIVPLEGRIDYLTLHTGRKFEVPFEVLIIFATNLKPETLADEAFLRRIPYKIAARNPSADEYARIFELNCRRLGLVFDPAVVRFLQRRYYEPRRLPMRACHPRDLLEQVVNLCRYHNREPALTRELLETACESYFVQEAAEEMGNAEGGRRNQE